MKTVLTFCMLMACMASTARNPQSRPLYPDGAPDSNGITTPEVWMEDSTRLGNVSVPMIHLWQPEKPNGRVVVICPGGGYGRLAVDHEGWMVAQWLNQRGITAVVLHYRMPNGHPEIPLNDLHEAIRTVRRNAQEWNVDPAKVGIMGFSAGGHLASTGAVYHDTQTRPDFAVLIYPVISMDDRIGHAGSRQNLLGPKAKLTPEQYNRLRNKYSTDLHVTEKTPTVFMALSDDDASVKPLNSTLFYNALKANGVAGELHIYPTGGHGWGWREDFPYHAEFVTSLGRWLDNLP